MPCRDGGPSLERIREQGRIYADYPKLKERADKVTRLLCKVLRESEAKNESSFEWDKELCEWWEAHKKEDEAREKREKAKKERLKIELQRNIDKLLNQLQELD
jgi:hypothetical protein